ncbi:HEAT repeat [Desulfonatronum thiosulfatophilum]|uniref:HEAT repeat n=1 Tax=Desulfonatronum thiosulfatophilum TaxID=617002 RepID=A0A1G6DEE7_9BACT|nr:HEAT repeat domain-containing protein [Desulfonatronum thiosulfatophilum]SDB43479.1 HEAT repeat [Desulfonatronum thiosulfatophilum]
MSDCDQIIQQLRSNDPEMLREAAQDAGDYGCSETVPLLISLLRSPNLGVQEASDLALRQLGGAEAVRGLCPLLRIEDAQVRNLAMDILREISEQDVNTIFSMLDDDDVDIRIFASDILGSTKNILAVPHLCQALLHDMDVNVRYQAAVSLGALGYAEAARCLNQAMNDEEWVQFSVIEALLKIRDDSSIDALIKAMPNSTDLVASMIVDALGEMGNLKSVPLLLKRLEESPPALRNKVVKAVVQIMGGRTLSLLPALEQVNFRIYLLSALSDEDVEIQDAAISGLASLRVEEAALPIITLAAKLDPDSDADLDRLEKIASALAEIKAMEPLRQTILGDDPASLSLAVKTLRRLTGPESSQLLMEVFWKHNRDVQRDLVDALLSVAGEEAFTFFTSLLEKHNDGHVLKQAMRFLSGPNGRNQDPAQTADRIFALLDHPYPDVREVALECCIALGHESLLEQFQQMFSSPAPSKRAMAILGLGSLGCDSHLDLIRTALEDESTAVRKAALEAGIKLCGLTEDIFALVSQRLHDEDREVRLTLVTLLGVCVCDVVNVVPVLKLALRDGDDWVRVRAVEALAGRRVLDAVPDLIALLQEQNTILSIKVVEALGQIGGQAAFQTLLALLGSDDQELVAVAEEAVIMLQEREEEQSRQ